MMKDNKYHIVHTESSGGWGGQEIRTLSEIQEFARNGHQVTLICDNDSPMAKRAIEYNINTVQLPIGKKTFTGLFALRTWFKENDFDVINTHSSSDSWMTAIGMRLALKVKPLVRTRHVSAPVSNNFATHWLYHKAANHIVTAGIKLKETLIKNNHISPEKITSVPTGIDTSLFIPVNDKTIVRQSLGLPTDKTIIGIVATLRSWKGHDYLIKAFHQLNDENTHLLIVGDGPQRDNIVKQIHEHGLEDKTTLCGDQKNVIPWLQSMDIFVLPSYANEGVPQSLMQAMSCGLPVISTDVGSIVEIVKHEETGLIIDTKNADSIRHALNRLINEKNTTEKLINESARLAKEKFGLSSMYEKMHHIFLSAKGTNEK
jgi:glycosyltransferase involved in cell wall biosynthesis